MVGVAADAEVFPHYSAGVMAMLFNGGGWLSYQKMQSAEFTGGRGQIAGMVGKFPSPAFSLKANHTSKSESESTSKDKHPSAMLINSYVSCSQGSFLVWKYIHAMFTVLWRPVYLCCRTPTCQNLEPALSMLMEKYMSSIFASWIMNGSFNWYYTLGAMRVCHRRRGKLLRCRHTVWYIIKLRVCKMCFWEDLIFVCVCVHDACICLISLILVDVCICDNAYSAICEHSGHLVAADTTWTG